MPHFVCSLPIDERNGVKRFTVTKARILSADEGYSHQQTVIETSRGSRQSVLFFFGYAVLGGHCVFDAQQADAMLARGFSLHGCNGAYIAVVRKKKSLEICTDFMGNATLFYYADQGRILVSTSFRMLIDEILQGGSSLEFNIDVCEKYLIRKMPTDQLFSPNTLVKGVRLITWGHHLRLDCETGRFQEHVNNLPDGANVSNYEDAITGMATEMLALMDMSARLAKVAEIPLTGGHDSRILYSAARYLGAERFNIYPVRKPRENEIARRVMALPREGEAPAEAKVGKKSPISPELALDRWERGNLGVYSFFHVDQAIPLGGNDIKIELRGGGGGAMRELFDDAAIDGIIDPDDANALMTHPVMPALSKSQRQFLAYRNRIHFGRTFSEGERLMWRIDPQNTWQMLIANRLLSRNLVERGQMVLDLLLILHPPAAFEEFDQKRKNFSRETFTESPFFLSRPDLSFQPIEIGEPSAFVDEFRVEPGQREWMGASAFRQEVTSQVTNTCLSSYPGDRESVESAVEEFGNEAIKGSFAEWGRQISKFHAIARLAESGVQKAE